MKRKNMRGAVDLLILGAILSVSSFFGVLSNQDKIYADIQNTAATTEIVQPAVSVKPEEAR